MATTKTPWESVSPRTIASHVLRSSAAEDLVADIEHYWSRQTTSGGRPVIGPDRPVSGAAESAMPVTLDQFVAQIERAYLQLLSGNPAEARRTLDNIRLCEAPSESAAATAPSPVAADAGPESAALRSSGSHARIVIRTLGGFDLMIGGRAFRALRKQPVRPLAMLKAIIAFGGTRVCGSALADALWPDLEGDRAHNTLCVTLHRLRELIGIPEAVTMQEGRLSLDPRCVRVDAIEFDSLSRRIDQPGDALLEHAFNLYRGPFLPEQADLHWTTRMRERLRCGFARIVTKAAVELEESGRLPDAALLYERALAVDDAAGSLVQPLARCWSQIGQEKPGRDHRKPRESVGGGSPSG